MFRDGANAAEQLWCPFRPIFRSYVLTTAFRRAPRSPFVVSEAIFDCVAY